MENGNIHYNLLKRSTLKQLRIKKKKNKSKAKRKSDKYFKHKRFIHSLFRKKSLKMNLNQQQHTEVISSSDRCPQKDEDEIDAAGYWKARAISLEFENNMLHRHIKQMYISMSNQNEQFAQENEYDDYSTQDMDTEDSENETETKKNEGKVDLDEEYSLPPDEYSSKKSKEEEMEALYGSSWRVVRGMETAVQLNFNITVGRKKSAYWPVVPIKI